MLRAHQESPSKRLLTVACCVLTTTIWAPGASAATIFFDNFNDGDDQDGSPVTWTPGPGTWDASSGDYVATGSIPRIARVTDQVLSDTSVRAQVRVTGTIHAGLAVRRTQPLVGYAGDLRVNGTVAIARVDGTPVILGEAAVPFSPVDQDILLQFDAFGDKLSLWAWPVGESMPDEPQVVVFDATYPEGPAGLISAAFAAAPTDATTYRFVHVADTHISDILRGDYNASGAVEQGDLDLVLLNWGKDAATPPTGWTNSLPTGAIDQEELDGVLLHWGEGATAVAGAPFAAAIPEPSAVAMCGICVLVLLGYRRRHSEKVATSRSNPSPQEPVTPRLFRDLGRMHLTRQLLHH